MKSENNSGSVQLLAGRLKSAFEFTGYTSLLQCFRFSQPRSFIGKSKSTGDDDICELVGALDKIIVWVIELLEFLPVIPLIIFNLKLL